MHIPDGYLSPVTCGVMGAAMVPVWRTAARGSRRVVKSRFAPLMAIGAAYSFLVMMFNVPIPDGTTAHAVGGVLIAVLLGPLGRGDRGQRRAAHPGALLRRRRRARLRREHLQHGVRHAVRRLRRVPLLTRRLSLTCSAAGVRRRHRRLRRPQRGRPLRGDRVRPAAGPCSTPRTGRRCTRRSTSRRRSRRWLLAHLTVAGLVESRAHRRRRRLPAAGQPADPAHQPCRRAATTTPSSARRRRARLALGAARAGRHGACSRRSACSRPGGAFGEDAPVDLNLAEVPPGRRPARASRLQRLLDHALLGGYGFGSGQHPSVGYLLSALVGIAAPSRIVVARARRASSGRRRQRDVATALGGAARDRRRRDAAAGCCRRELGLCPCGCIGKRRKGSFVEKTIGGGAALMQQAMFTDDVAGAAGPAAAHRPAGRSSLSLIALLVATALVRHIPVLIAAVRRSRSSWRPASRLSLRVLRQARLAVHPDLHRHHRAPGDVQLHHAGRRSSCRSAPGSGTTSGSRSRA